MKTILKLLKTKLLLGLPAILILVACENDNELNTVSENEQDVAVAEAEADAVYEDIDDLVLLSLTEETSSGGRIEEDDDRFCENVISVEGNKMSGTVTIDFGEGCQDRNGNVRKGMIVIEYQGGKLIPGSTVTTTLIEYSINDISIEGVRTLTNISESIESYPTFNITLQNGKITWPDNTFATREVNRVRVWVNANNPLNDEHHVTGVANGITRRGVTYDMVVTDTLIYKRNCRVSRRGRLPVQGEKQITTDNKLITVDYGDGECDTIVEIIVEGNREEVEVE